MKTKFIGEFMMTFHMLCTPSNHNLEKNSFFPKIHNFSKSFSEEAHSIIINYSFGFISLFLMAY